MRRVLLGVALLAAVGCGDEPAPAEAPHAEQEAVARAEPTEVEMVAAMEAHYGAVILAHDGLQQGDVEKLRRQLALVSDQPLPASAPSPWLPYHERLQHAASLAETAGDLDAAARVLASVALACGRCHQALVRGPVYPAPAPDESAEPLKAAMLDHEWATERLWEGVTGPWDEAWRRGAAELAATRVFGEPDTEPTDDLRRREQALRDLGAEAMNTTALDARAYLYGRLLGTCADCHRASGVTFEAPPAPPPD